LTEIFLDIETYSSVDIKKSNVYRYVTAPDFRVLMLAWAEGRDGEVAITTDPEEMQRVAGLARRADHVIWAHNTTFERICFSQLLGLDVERGEFLPPDNWEDTQPLAAEWGYPQRLEPLAEVLGGEKKDAAGTRLINLFSKPNRQGRRVLPEERPAEWQEFLDYCVQDVVTLQDIARALPSWPTPLEREVWLADQRINDRGMPVDLPMALQAMEAAEENKVVHELEMFQLSGIENPGSHVQMKAWLSSEGLELPNLQADTITETLARDDLTPTVRRVLELRQELALVAAKKYQAAVDRLTADHRLRGSFHFFGAHTGRWAGRGVQLQNLPRETIEPVNGESVDAAIAANVMDLALGNGADAHTLKALVRPMFKGPFIVVDYSAIEARVVAWLAGESWALEAFEAGRDIYVETAERMGGLTRDEGKVAVLALGYNGGIGSLRAMGAEGTDRKLQFMVNQWRETNSNIVALWRNLEEAFRKGDSWAGDKLYVERGDKSSRRVVLPSGRAISYHRVGQKWIDKTWPNGDTSRVRQLSYMDAKKAPGRIDTYGGRLTENATQAVARDILAAAIVRLERAGYPVVGHVHDEIIVEGTGERALAEVTEIMTEPLDWSAGLPIAAEGFLAPRYRKG